MFPVDEHEEADVDHVPRGAVFISHQIQSHGHVRVTVITAEVVLETKSAVTFIEILTLLLQELLLCIVLIGKDHFQRYC